MRLPLDAYTVGDGADLADDDGGWQTTYGIGDDGAVLVRPDGYVAWRSRSGAGRGADTLPAVIAGVLGRR
jgi:putative polyketide hydroxylase